MAVIGAVVALLTVGSVTDEDAHCSAWALAGECERNSHFMLRSCAVACEHVARGDIPPDRAGRRGDDDAHARDLVPECEGYAQAGECWRNPAYNMQQCKKSCLAWEQAHGLRLDRLSTCVDSALRGQCGEKVTAQLCNTSCEIMRLCSLQNVVNIGVCDKALRCEPIDKGANCRERARAGDCAREPQRMAQHCLASCMAEDLEGVLHAHLAEKPAILSPHIDVPAAVSRKYERCGIRSFFDNIGHYKLMFPDKCWWGRDIRVSRPGRPPVRLPWRRRVLPNRNVDVVHALRGENEPCPYDSSTTTPRVPVRTKRIQLEPSWHTQHAMHVSHVLVSPRIRLVHNFLAEGEAEEILAHAKPRFDRSPVASVATRMRTSSTAFFRDKHPVADKIRARVAALSGYPLRALEPLQVVRYEPGQHYAPHMDSFDVCDFDRRPRRHLTFLIYMTVRLLRSSSLAECR